MKYLPSAPREITLKWLEETAHQFVVHIISVPTDTTQDEADVLFNRHRSFLHAALLYTRTFNMQ
jgi:hypothetical protein